MKALPVLLLAPLVWLSPPLLATLQHDGKPVPVVIQGNKTGFLYVLDRDTGKPVFPVEERPVKQDARLFTSPTQPFPVGADTAAAVPGTVVGRLVAGPAGTIVVRDRADAMPMYEQLIAELDKGNVDVSHTATPYLVQAVLAGSDSVAVVGGLANPVFAVMAKPNIKSFVELRGKTIGLVGLGKIGRSHEHEDEEEAYYVLEGSAEVRLGAATHWVSAGSYVL